MNQEQVKEKLLQIDGNVTEFSVLFSGKKSRKVDGLYHPDSCEILIHNHNFSDDNALMYTAIHEFAHHIQFSRSSAPVSSKAHTTQFYDILHRLLFEAERKGVYRNIFKSDPRFLELTGKIQNSFLSANGKLMKEFGQILIEAHTLCRETGTSFEDYLDRELGLNRTTAKTIIKMHSMDINPEIGYENMKTVASIRDPEMAKMAEEAFMEGRSPDMVKAEFTARPRQDTAGNVIEQLVSEKDRIEKTMERLTVRLGEIERRIQDLSTGQ
ncbi:MAG TPA: hypothetical protein PK544_02500 [Spirochaetota bacterium]|nr:hypothetical protein [Spirochaetota bacterium]HPJ37672.1 hypothetical protein [Spirochaetota bacterium]HPQ53527.1 hypothetical protein [Spirochaetota bacterium]